MWWRSYFLSLRGPIRGWAPHDRARRDTSAVLRS
nr:MAG TPA: hypothetical protein [Caudoviricetes sp.]